MISFLSGKIINKITGAIILLVDNIGYKVYINQALYADCEVGRPLNLYTHQHVREDALDLYGFRNLEELELFEMLLSVSGIGPETALGIFAVIKPDDLKETIANGDPSLLTKVSGIGKKTAERVVLELQNKIAKLTGLTKRGIGVSGSMSVSSDEIDALMALGYSLQQAREALNGVDKSITESSQRIKLALQKIK